MDLKSGILVLLLLFTLLNRLSADINTCGAPHEGGEFMEYFPGGHSYMSYDIDERFMKEDTFSYQDRFCTNNGSGIIAQITSEKQRENIHIEVINGHVTVNLIQDDNVDEDECMFEIVERVTDGTSYLIKMEIKGKELNLFLFREDSVIQHLKVSSISRCLTGNFLTFTHVEKGGEKIDISLSEGFQTKLGLLHRGKPHLYGSITACIGDSILNGIPLAKAGKQLEKHDIDPSCDLHFGPECTGICGSSYIVDGGEKCRCPDESEIDGFGLCKASCNCVKCQNGGTCILKSETDTMCKCPPGYEGKYCDVKIDLCRGFDCQNGGSCSVASSGPYCVCPPGVIGMLCEVVIPPEDPCKDNKCQNNGTCEGNSTLEEKYFCSCLPTYEGKYCEHQPGDNAEFKLTGGILTAVIIGVLLVISVIAGLLFYIIKRQRSKQDQGPADSSAAENGAAENGTAYNGAADNGIADDGAADNGTANNGAADNGTANSGPADNATADDGAADNGQQTAVPN